MKKSFLIILFPMLCSSQVMTNVAVFDNSNGGVFKVKNTQFKSYDGIDGIPYADQTFSSAKIDGFNQAVPPMRYNIYEDEMEFKVNNQINYLLKEGELGITFIPSNKRYVLKDYIVDGVSTKGYLVELVRGRFDLYKKEVVQIVDYNNNTTNTYLKEKNPYFEKSKDIMLIYDGQNYTRFPKNAKELNLWLKGKSVSGSPKDIEAFMKNNKLNFNKDADVMKLVSFLNTAAE